MKSIRKLIMVCTVLVLISSTFCFSKTKGLMDSYGNYVYEYMSSGSNDNVCIGLSVVIFLPFFVFLFTLKKRISIWEFFLVNLLLIIQGIMLSVMDVGSILNTIKNGNIPLLIWFLCYCALFVEVYVFFRYEGRMLEKRKKRINEKN